jgi:putative colanic acid biosynthesis acetyltransferase WcaF
MKTYAVNPVNLARFGNDAYRPGRPLLIRALWFFVGLPILRCSLLPLTSLRRIILRLFGARVGRGVVIKPGVRIKYPWLFGMGDYCWIGEDCWIDNIAPVTLGNHVCISQGAYLCTGNHDWSDPTFGLLINPIDIHDGVWIGAKALVTPGVEVSECAVVTAGSVVTQDIPPYEIHGGNPAAFLRRREIRARYLECAQSENY